MNENGGSVVGAVVVVVVVVGIGIAVASGTNRIKYGWKYLTQKSKTLSTRDEKVSYTRKLLFWAIKVATKL